MDAADLDRLITDGTASGLEWYYAINPQNRPAPVGPVVSPVIYTAQSPAGTSVGIELAPIVVLVGVVLVAWLVFRR